MSPAEFKLEMTAEVTGILLAMNLVDPWVLLDCYAPPHPLFVAMAAVFAKYDAIAHQEFGHGWLELYL